MPDYTYCTGPSYTIKNSVSKHILYKIANELSDVFGDGYTFEPEKITEGGFVMTKYPNKLPNAYKSIRLNWMTNYSKLYDKKPWYPHVPGNWRELWKEDNEIVYSTIDDSFREWSKKTRSKLEKQGMNQEQILKHIKVVWYEKKKIFKPTIHNTELKAFCGAPIWSEQEVIKVFNVFDKNGWIHYKRGNQKKILKLNTKLCNTDDGSWMSCVGASHYLNS